MAVEEGVIHITKMTDDPSDPEPWTYGVTFSPYGTGGARPIRKVLGDDALTDLLVHIGVLTTEAQRHVRSARVSVTTIERVRLTPEQQKQLGL